MPPDAQSLHFAIYGDRFEVRANDTVLPVIYTLDAPASNPNLQTADAVADISAFAGQTATLKFITIDFDGSTRTDVNGLDSIEFSPIPVPEPGTATLFGAGLFSFGVLWLYRARRGKQQTE